MRDGLVATRLEASRPKSGASAELTSQERAAVEHGRLFCRLPAGLRSAILGRAYVWRFKDGEPVLPADAAPDHWIGVASGELLGSTRSLDSGKPVATHVLGPGAWLSMYSPLCDVSHRGIGFFASGATCVIALSRRDTLELAARWPELVMAMIELSAMNLRFAHLMLQEAQGNYTLEQKLLRWLDAGVSGESAAGDDGGRVFRSTLPQATLAAAAGVSRQSWNAGMARLEHAGLVRRLKDGLAVRDLQRLQAALRRSGLFETEQLLQAGARPVRPPLGLPGELLPIHSLRGNERAALGRMRWHERLSVPLREKVLARMKVLRLSDKSSIAAADRRAPGWVAIVEGGLRVLAAPAQAAQGPMGEGACRTSAKGVIAQLPAGATFFEYALIDRCDCGADVQCEGSTTLLLLDPDAFRGLLASEADFALGVLKWLCASHHQVALLKLTLSLPMPMRLHAWLDALVRLSGQADGPWIAVPMPLSQAELGATLSSTRQYVGKALNELEAAGALVRLHGAVRIRRDALPLAARSWASVDAMAEPGWQGAGAHAGPSAQSRSARESAR